MKRILFAAVFPIFFSACTFRSAASLLTVTKKRLKKIHRPGWQHEFILMRAMRR